MDKIFVNIIILYMLCYFKLFKGYFHCPDLFHPTLFMTIYGYFYLFMVIFLFLIISP